MARPTFLSSSRSGKRFREYIYLMIPALVIYTAFHVYPILRDVGIAMTDALSVGSEWHFIGLENFRRLLFEPGPVHDTFTGSFFWTVIYWLGNWTLNILLGLGFALIVFEGIRLQRVFTVVIFMPYVVSNLAMGFIMRLLLDPSNGALNWLLVNSGLLAESVNFLQEGWPASLTLIATTGWKFAGFNLALFLGGLVTIPTDTLDSALVDGCNYGQKLFRVIIPQLWPTILSVSILCLTGTWQLLGLPVALSGSTEGAVDSIDVIVVVFYRWAFGRVGFGMASAMMVLVAIFLAGGAIFAQYMQRKKTVEY